MSAAYETTVDARAKVHKEKPKSTSSHSLKSKQSKALVDAPDAKAAKAQHADAVLKSLSVSKSAKHVEAKSSKGMSVGAIAHSMSAAYETTVDALAKVHKEKPTSPSHSVKSKQSKVIVEMPDAKASKAQHADAVLKSLSVSKSAKHVEAKSAKGMSVGSIAQSMPVYETTVDHHAKVQKEGSTDDGKRKSKQAKVLVDMPDAKAAKAHDAVSAKSKSANHMSYLDKSSAGHDMSSPFGKSSKRSKRSKAKKGDKSPSPKSTAGELVVSSSDDGWQSPHDEPEGGFKLFAKHDKRWQESRIR